MIPFILAALGGAFIGNALSSDDKKIESETILDKDNFEVGGKVGLMSEYSSKLINPYLAEYRNKDGKLKYYIVAAEGGHHKWNNGEYGDMGLLFTLDLDLANKFASLTEEQRRIIYTQVSRDEKSTDRLMSKNVDNLYWKYINKNNFEVGGAVPNNYEGKTAEHIWGDWTTEQREHYIVDHFGVKALDNDYQNKDWYELPSDVQIHTEIHIMQGQYAKGGMIVTKISDIPDLDTEIEKGKVTYRGLGLGKLQDRFLDLANELGTRIKVKGKEYFITDTEFRKLAWDDKAGKWNGKIRFAAPFRKYADGGGIDKPNYQIFEGRDHFNDKPLYKVIGVDVENDYVGEWHKDKVDAEKELDVLNKSGKPESRIDKMVKNWNEEGWA